MHAQVAGRHPDIWGPNTKTQGLRLLLWLIVKNLSYSLPKAVEPIGDWIALSNKRLISALQPCVCQIFSALRSCMLYACLLLHVHVPLQAPPRARSGVPPPLEHFWIPRRAPDPRNPRERLGDPR